MGRIQISFSEFAIIVYFSLMFANIATMFSLWLIDVLLFVGGIYLIWRTYKIYRQKSHQKKNAEVVSKELEPFFNALQNEIQNLRQEIQHLKAQNGKSDFDR